MDEIILKGLEFYGYHGVLPEEKSLGQKFIVDLKLSLELQEAGQKDTLQDTVNYAQVYSGVREIIEGKSYDLIEAVAEKVAQYVLENYQRVQGVEVRIEKPQAPIAAIFNYVGVVIRRERIR